jgi:hypothetical protein
MMSRDNLKGKYLNSVLTYGNLEKKKNRDITLLSALGFLYSLADLL